MTISAAPKTEDDPPEDPAEREAAWLRAIAVKDYRIAARIARLPLLPATWKDEHGKWRLWKFHRARAPRGTLQQVTVRRSRYGGGLGLLAGRGNMEQSIAPMRPLARRLAILGLTAGLLAAEPVSAYRFFSWNLADLVTSGGAAKWADDSLPIRFRSVENDAFPAVLPEDAWREGVYRVFTA